MMRVSIGCDCSVRDQGRSVGDWSPGGRQAAVHSPRLAVFGLVATHAGLP